MGHHYGCLGLSPTADLLGEMLQNRPSSSEVAGVFIHHLLSLVC